MIYDFVSNKLKAVATVGENVFPVGVNIDDIYSTDQEFSFTVYTFTRRTPEVDLEGDLHHYKEEVLVDFIGYLYEKVHAMYDAVEKAFTVSNLDTGTGEYVFSIRCSSPQPDAFDPELGLLRRTMQLSIQWVPVSEEV
jgi:hypothetical protein